MNEIARLLKEHGAVRFGDFVLASGARSSYYMDIKSVVTDPAVLSAIAAAVARKFSFEVVAGVAVGGVPLAVAVSLASGKPFAIVRSQEKSHGREGKVIGQVKGRQVLLVEDVTTSGDSAVLGARALRDEGAVVDTVVTVVDRGAGAEVSLRRHALELVALATAAEILEA